ncbi:hypothetical protein GCM10027443_06010 [Pontibacter brevis]
MLKFLETILNKSITQRMVAKALAPILALPSASVQSSSELLENIAEAEF